MTIALLSPQPLLANAAAFIIISALAYQLCTTFLQASVAGIRLRARCLHGKGMQFWPGQQQMVGARANSAVQLMLPVKATPSQQDYKHQPVSHQQSNQLFKAWDTGKLAWGFSAGGFLFAYHCGVVKALRSWGLLDRDSKLAGVSAGSLVAALVICDIPTQEIQNMYFECVDELRRRGTRGNMREVLKAAMERHLPHNAHQLCSGRLHVGVSQFNYFVPSNVQISHFETRQDLIETLLASCHLPRYSSPDWAVMLRGKLTVDGGFTGLVPSLPEELGYHTVKVCCLPASRVARLPFLNKQAAMHNVAIIPDHPRTQLRLFETSQQQSINLHSSASNDSIDTLDDGSADDAASSDGSLACISRSSSMSKPSTPTCKRTYSTSGTADVLISESAALPVDDASLVTASDYGYPSPVYSNDTNIASDVNVDIVEEMQAWVNLPAPTNDFYVRLMQKAEQDTQGWLWDSGLANHIQQHGSRPC